MATKYTPRAVVQARLAKRIADLEGLGMKNESKEVIVLDSREGRMMEMMAAETIRTAASESRTWTESLDSEKPRKRARRLMEGEEKVAATERTASIAKRPRTICQRRSLGVDVPIANRLLVGDRTVQSPFAIPVTCLSYPCRTPDGSS